MTGPAVTTPDPGSPAQQKAPLGFVAMRAAPDQKDAQDNNRIQLCRGGWSAQDDLVRQQNRQIEENVRMVSGQQHAIFHPLLNRWLDVADWMPTEERRWRTRAVFNRLLKWFILTHARMTENTPIVTFVPGPDHADAELAEVLDIACKTVWWEANMEDVHDRLMGWLCVGGRGHLMTRIDPNKGQMRPWIGQDMVPVVDPNGQPIDDGQGGSLSQMAQGVPFGPDGKPRAVWRMHAPGAGELVPTGPAHQTPVGALVVDVHAPMQVRGSWGPDPWHMKRQHRIRSFLTPEQVFEAWGVQVAPTVRGGQVSDLGELERLLFGTGFYGSVEGKVGTQLASTNTEGYVEVTQLWEAPASYGNMQQSEGNPGGRWLVVTPDTVIRDGPRPAAYPYTSPLSTFEFIRVPGRNGGTTPQEALNPIQRVINDGHGRIKDHVNLSTNPKGVIDSASGLKAGKFTNAPGENYVLNRRPGVPAIEYVAPPPLGEDVYKWLGMAGQEFDEIGFLVGAADTGSPGESGEKLKEARFNTDRFLGPTMRRAAGEYGRMFETWRATFPLIWDLQTTIQYAGDDNIGRTITVYPYMFEQGKVHVRPDVESMLPEGRGEKQDEVRESYAQGLFGPPGSPEAIRKYWDNIAMPHLARQAKPGGVDGVTAAQHLGKILLGTDPSTIPVYEWYDPGAHLFVFEQFMKSPEFEKLAPPIQDALAFHRQALKSLGDRLLIQAAQHQAGIQSILAPPPMPGAGPGGPPSAGGPGGPPGAGPPKGPRPVNPPVDATRPALPAPPRGVQANALPTVAGAGAG